jgi:hypothetical protein
MSNNKINKIMKNRIYVYVIVGLAVLFSGCEEENHLKPFGPDDNKAPGTVSMVSYDQIPGGAEITFLAPSDPDLMYVKAVYTLDNGERRESISSAYANKLAVEGFGNREDKDIVLSAVDRMKNEGSGTKVTVTPGQPTYLDAFESIELGSTFGGVYVSMSNPDKGNLVVELLWKNEYGEWQELYTEYTSRENIRFAVRGMDTVAYNFGAFVRDPWNNRTDTIFETLTPIFEQELDRNKFAERFEKNDIAVNAFGFRLSNLWDGYYADAYNNMIHTPETGNVWPAHFTFDLGVTAELSRLKYWQRGGGYLYSHGNPRTWEIWGRADAPDPNDEWGGWTLLTTCESIKPSGLPLGYDSYTAEDREYAEKGEEFEFPPGLGAVKYIRVRVTSNWSNTQFFHIMEMHFWGLEAE